MRVFAISFCFFLFLGFQLQGQFNLEIEGSLNIEVIEKAGSDSLFIVADTVGNFYTRARSTMDIGIAPIPLDIYPGYRDYGLQYQETSIYKKNGRVYLEGLLGTNLLSDVIENGDTLAIIPLELRPTNRILASGYQNSSSPRVDILTTGEVIVVSGADGINNYISLHSINYKLEDYKIGDRVGGGILFYIAAEGEDLNGDGLADRGLVAAPEDLAGRKTWCVESDDIPEAGNPNVGAGYENTNAIIQLCEGGIAAQAALDYSINNHIDWFLPSQDELIQMHHNIGYGATGANENIASFARELYWSSTQRDANTARGIQLTNGFIGFIGFKSTAYFVRPIRVF